MSFLLSKHTAFLKVIFFFNFLLAQQPVSFEVKMDSLWLKIYTQPERVIPEALRMYDEMLKRNDAVKIPQLENLIGSAYLGLEEYPKAMRYMLKSLESNKKIKNIRGMYVNMSNLGAICVELKEYEKARSYLTRALHYFEMQKEYLSVANTWNNLGLCYQNSQNYPKAREAYNRAYYYFITNGSTENAIKSILNLGYLFFNYLNQKDSALKYYSLALHYADSLGDDQYRFSAMSSIWFVNKDKKIMQRIVSLNPENLLLGQQQEYYDFVKDYYNIIGNYKKALENFYIFDSIRKIKEVQKGNYEARILLMQNEYSEIKKEDSIRVEREKKLARMQLEKQRLENRQNNILKWSFIVISLIIGFFLIILFNRFRLIQKQKVIIEEQKQITENQKRLIEIKQKEILDSINYAQRIQQSLIDDNKKVFDFFSNFFFIYLPKDIVSGDFIWFSRQEKYLFVCCCDSTGHGVPGSYMSLLNMAFISEAINERHITEPQRVFDYVRERLIQTISHDKKNKDGFDGSILRLEVEDNKIKPGKIQWVSANNKIILIRRGEPEVMTYQRMPVGYYESMEPFRSFETEVNRGDILILSSDGIYDQFGGEKNKKFTFRRFCSLLTSVPLPAMEQKILDEFHKWKTGSEQTDDICILGMEI